MEQGLLGWLCAEDKVQGQESGRQARGESLQPPRRLASNVKGMGCTGGCDGHRSLSLVVWPILATSTGAPSLQAQDGPSRVSSGELR